MIVLTAAALAGTRHGFLGRTGGVSAGLYASLNCGLGSADDAAAVHENRARALAAVAPHAALAGVHQVHSAVCVTVTDAADRPRADAMVTATPGLALGILTADCAPVLFADTAAGVIGAAHAGWGGALGGVLEATAAAMRALGATAISAAVGPCIARRSYEVGPEFVARFTAADPAYEQHFTAGRDAAHWQFDLEGFCLARLAAAGVGRVEALGQDTYAQPERFFSYRCTTHAGEPDYGRQLSLIAL